MDRFAFRFHNPAPTENELGQNDFMFLGPEGRINPPPEVAKLQALIDKVIYRLENLPTGRRSPENDTNTAEVVVKQEPKETGAEAQASEEEEGLIHDDSEASEQEETWVKSKKHKKKHQHKSKEKKNQHEKRHSITHTLDDEYVKPPSPVSDDDSQPYQKDYKISKSSSERYKHGQEKLSKDRYRRLGLPISAQSSSEDESSYYKDFPIAKGPQQFKSYAKSGYGGESLSWESQKQRSPSEDSSRSFNFRSQRSPSLSSRRSPSLSGRKSSSRRKRRSSSHRRRRSTSPLRRRSPSPLRRRSPSPLRRRSPSPVRRRSPSPLRRRIPSPQRRKSPSLRRWRSPLRGRRSPLARSRSPGYRKRSPLRYDSSTLKSFRSSASQSRKGSDSHSSPEPSTKRSPPPKPQSERSQEANFLGVKPKHTLRSFNVEAENEPLKTAKDVNSPMKSLEQSVSCEDSSVSKHSPKQNENIAKAAEKISIKKEPSADGNSRPMTEVVLDSKTAQESRSLVDYDDLPTAPDSREGSPVVNAKVKREVKAEPQDYYYEEKYSAAGDAYYYCSVCQLSLNSQLTFESHMRGKKHLKAVKAQTVNEIAKGSIAASAAPVPLDGPRYAAPPVGRKRVLQGDISRIQTTVNDHKQHPMPGLERIIEIRVENETTYYCELCDAPCGPSSIMPHLIGFKHQLNCIKAIDTHYYDRIKDKSKKSVENHLITELFSHQRRHGKGVIRVYRDVPDVDSKAGLMVLNQGAWDNPDYRSHIPSQNQTVMLHEPVPGSSRGSLLNDDYLDTSKGDFYCNVCDSHMNNINMWEAHVRGKRHLKNTKKIPGESKCKAKVFKAPPGTRCNLAEQVKREADNEIVVGLDFIRETQGQNGEIYNCFLCGSCCTNIDIIDHILNTKHRIKYLEKMHADGRENSIATISQMDLGDFYFRENLIKEEVYRMEKQYGRGKVEVYVSKN